MGSCIKALLTGSRREELECLDVSLHTSSECKYHCQGVGILKTTNASTSEQDDVSTAYSSSASYKHSQNMKRNSSTLTDVNSANYHQLRVLAKISTDEAKAIVNYREFVCGGKFRSVDQLIDIPGGGVTPDKLQHIKNSTAVSHVSLAKDIEFTETRTKSCKPLNTEQSEVDETVYLDFINSANCHQLCVLARISIRQAETIIKYKVHECQGRFSSVGQLLNIREGGITPEKLEYILNHSLTAGNKTHDSPKRKQARRISASKLCDQTAVSLPAVTNVPHFGKNRPSSRSNENLIRIGSWNLECFTTSKVSNLGVLEVVCMTILMNGLDVIAFQELGDNDAIKKVCEELNHPTLAKVQSWPSRKGKWKCVVSEKTGRMYQGMEYSAFIWNESNGLHIGSCGLLGNQKKGSDGQDFVRKPFLGSFHAGDWTFVVISVHLKSAGWNGEHAARVTNEIELLSPLIKATSEVVKGKQDIILLGDFNMSPDNSSFVSLSKIGYSPLFPANEPTNISVVNPKGNHSYDNMWITTKLYEERYTGLYKIVRRGLQHQLIEGKKPGTKGTVSNHCPIWASFSN